MLLWRNRFTERGPTGLAEDAPHGRSSRRTKDKVIKAIVEATLHTTPADATHWSTRTMASKCGVSNATVCRIWDAHGLQPQEPPPIVLSVPHSRLTDVAARLSFCLGIIHTL